MTTAKPSLKSLLARHEVVLLLVIALEVVLFSALGRRFLDGTNVSNIFRHSVEIGLLALAMTPVILTGGIDLSVGSMMGLCAVCFGIFVNEAEMSPLVAGLSSVGIGALGGGLNALLIARFKLPPLIVTLGTFSLFRGLAEGITAGVDNFTRFPASFLFLGQGYLAGGLPAQLPVLIVVAAAFWMLLHRTTLGRAWVAIGFSPEGARHAGIPVERRLALAYILSGAVSALAAIVYVAHLGQAKADAGLGMELLAITAVVLGGTSIFGGVGSVGGTLLGLFAIAVLQNGLRLADLPAELAGILAGALLIFSLASRQIFARLTGRIPTP